MIQRFYQTLVIGSNFNTGFDRLKIQIMVEHRFTAPHDGRYLCCYTIQIGTSASNWLWVIHLSFVNGSNTQTQAKGVVYADMAGTGVTGNSTTECTISDVF